jgi:serine/threonine-protein kinase
MPPTSNPPPSATRLPRKFGRYMLFDVVGKGGMAEIFLARAKTSELGGYRLCVVKQIIPAFAQHSQFAEMLIHEAKLAAMLDHAHIVQVFDLGRADGELFIAMEYVEGFDLNELLRRCTKAKIPLPFEFALLILADTLEGLDYAHRRADDFGVPYGIVHRDVSPSNVLISYGGQSKVCDFGIAHANELVWGAASSSGALAGDALQGKAGYMSPEHARGESIDARADVFAVGILLWELIAGHRMYRPGPDKDTLLEQARAAVVPALPDRILTLPHQAELRRIVSKALAVDRDQRYASANAMQRDLEAYAVTAKLLASPLKFGEWLEASFGTEVMTQRRMRQRAAEALEMGPAVTLTPLPFPAAEPQAPEARGEPVAQTITAPLAMPAPAAPAASAAPSPDPAPVSAPPKAAAAIVPGAAAERAIAVPPAASLSARRGLIAAVVAVLALVVLGLVAILYAR